MATITSVGSGNWGTAGTWDAGVPADGDDVVIASGHTVTFNADQSAFATGVKITITGTLNHALTGGPYTMFIKTGASVVGAGTWNVGTSANPIPFAVKHTITGAAGWYVDGVSGLIMTVYGTEPTNKYIQLSGAEAAGQTELSVATDVTGDIWAVGDTVLICNHDRSVDVEKRVIDTGGIAATTITVSAGLTAAKLSGAYIVLATRNVRIVPTGTPTRSIYRVTGLAMGSCEIPGVGKYVWDTCVNGEISGGVYYEHSYSVNAGSGMVISGGAVCKSSAVVLSSTGFIINGGFFSGHSTYIGRSNITINDGLFVGNKPLTYGELYINGGVFSGNESVISLSDFAVITGGTFEDSVGLFGSTSKMFVSGGTFSAMNTIFNAIEDLVITGGTFASGISDVYGYSNAEAYGVDITVNGQKATELTYSSADKFDNVAGAFKAWAYGGITTSQATVLPSGYSLAYITVPSSATYPTFWKKAFSVPAGESVSVEVQLRKSASMAYLPRVYLMNSVENAVLGDTPVDSFTMTDSTDTWESDTFTIDNSAGTTDKEYTLWFVAKNESGNVYSAYDITTAGGGGGGGFPILQGSVVR